MNPNSQNQSWPANMMPAGPSSLAQGWQQAGPSSSNGWQQAGPSSSNGWQHMPPQQWMPTFGGCPPASAITQPWNPSGTSSYKNTQGKIYYEETDECSICTGKFKELKALTCRHYPFCNTCLREVGRAGPLQCPVCKRAIFKVFRITKVTQKKPI